MLRVIGGSLGGRQFASPPGRRAHPMSDRIRGALFNALGDLSGLTVLDGFGGSGALSFEAISRGADSVLICEKEPRVATTIAKNIAALGLEGQIKLFTGNVYSWMNHHPDQFDVVLVDPPYQDFAGQKLPKLLSAVKSGGIMAVSHPSDASLPELDAKQLKAKRYANAALAFYRKTD